MAPYCLCGVFLLSRGHSSPICFETSASTPCFWTKYALKQWQCSSLICVLAELPNSILLKPVPQFCLHASSSQHRTLTSSPSVFTLFSLIFRIFSCSTVHLHIKKKKKKLFKIWIWSSANPEEIHQIVFCLMQSFLKGAVIPRPSTTQLHSYACIMNEIKPHN